MSENEITVGDNTPTDFFDEVYIEIEVNPKNRMTAKYFLYGVGESETQLEIESRLTRTNGIGAEISPRVYRENIKNTLIDVKYRGNSEILVEIQPYGFVEIDVEIEVPPHNTMWAIYEVQQPPIIDTVFKPTKDSFVRKDGQFSTINYGSSTSMVVGRQYGDEWQSLIGFDGLGFQDSIVTIGSKLRVYYSGVIANGVSVALYEASKQWGEYSVTYANRPDAVNFITDKYTVNTIERYVEFDVSDIINKWLNGDRINNGFMIKLGDNSYDSQVVFKTRQSLSPPQLIVSHYDSRIFSTGRSQILAEISTKQRRNKDILTEIEVGSIFRFETIDTEIRVHRIEEPLWEDYEAEITVSKIMTPVELSVSVSDENQILSELEVRNSRISVTDAHIYINRPVAQAELFVKYTNSVDVEITPKSYGYSEPETEISISRELLNSEIFIRFTNDVIAELEVAREDINLTNVEIGVNRPILDSEIYIKYYNNIDSEITARGTNNSDVITTVSSTRDLVFTEVSSRIGDESNLNAIITVTKDGVHSEIYVKYVDDILVEIEPNIKSDTLAEVYASRPYTNIEITSRVQDESDVNSEIFIYYQEYKDAEINVHVFDQINVEIKAKLINQVDAEITVNKPYIGTVITVPYYGESDLITEIEPRILMVDNIETVIVVSGRGGAYVFIV